MVMCYKNVYFVFVNCCYTLLTDNQTLIFTLQDSIHFHTPYGIVSCAFVCLVLAITTRAPVPVQRAVGLFFLAGFSIFDIHTIALSNCVEYMVDVMTSHSWYCHFISAELLSGHNVFYITYQ